MRDIVTPDIFAEEPALVAGVTTRQYAPPDVSRDDLFARLARDTGMGVASVGQVHGADVATVIEPGHTPAHDGLVTDCADLLLAVVAADCGLVLLADAKAGVVGACHSGWRGTVAGVVERTVRAMVALGASPARMLSFIGPCISTEAFEVGEEVAEAFGADSVLRRPEWEKPHVDLKSDLQRRLVHLGIKPDAVERSEACTVGDNGTFYSFRAEGGTPGRIVGFIGRRGSH